MTTCVKCGCTDFRACMTDGSPCHWALMSTRTMKHGGQNYAPEELGICSSCDNDSEPEGFERVDGDFDPADPDVFEDGAGSDLILPGDPEFHL